MLGDHEEATRGMRKVLALAERTHEQPVRSHGRSAISRTRCWRSLEPTKEAQAEARALADGLRVVRPHLAAMVRGLLKSRLHCRAPPAMQSSWPWVARESVELLRRTPAYLEPWSIASYWPVLLRRARSIRASRVAEAAMLYLAAAAGDLLLGSRLISRSADAWSAVIS